jgi:hypothetical protein
MGMNATVDNSLRHIHAATNNFEVGGLPSIVLRQPVNPYVCITITIVRICPHIINGGFYLAELTNITNPLSYQVAEVGSDTMSFGRITPVKGSSRRVPIDVIGKPQAFTASMCFVALKPISALFIRESIGFAIYPKL